MQGEQTASGERHRGRTKAALVAVEMVALSLTLLGALVVFTPLGDGSRVFFHEHDPSKIINPEISERIRDIIPAETRRRVDLPHAVSAPAITPHAIWVVGYQSIVARFASDSFDLQATTRTGELSTVLALTADDQQAWAATTGGVFRIDSQGRTTALAPEPTTLITKTTSGIWAAGDKTLLRIDDDGVRHTPIAFTPSAIAATDDAVWLLDGPSPRGRNVVGLSQWLWRIDARTGNAQRQLEVLGAASVAIAGNALWVSLPGELVRVDPTSGTATSEDFSSCDYARPITSDGHALWAAGEWPLLEQIDPTSGRGIAVVAMPYNNPSALAVSATQLYMVNAASNTSFVVYTKSAEDAKKYPLGPMHRFDGSRCARHDFSVQGTAWHVFARDNSLRFALPSGDQSFSIPFSPTDDDSLDLDLASDSPDRVWVVRQPDIALIDLHDQRVVGRARLVDALGPFTLSVTDAGLKLDDGVGGEWLVSRRDFSVHCGSDSSDGSDC